MSANVLCLHPQHPSSTTPPIDIAPSRLKLMRRGPDRKSEFLRALKDEGTGELTTSSSPGTSGEVRASPQSPGKGREIQKFKAFFCFVVVVGFCWDVLQAAVQHCEL